MNNINMEYIPAYSPDFNPIEMVFSKIKTFYRKLDHTNIEEDIKNAISKVTF
jgi:transposase